MWPGINRQIPILCFGHVQAKCGWGETAPASLRLRIRPPPLSAAALDVGAKEGGEGRAELPQKEDEEETRILVDAGQPVSSCVVEQEGKEAQGRQQRLPRPFRSRLNVSFSYADNSIHLRIRPRLPPAAPRARQHRQGRLRPLGRRRQVGSPVPSRAVSYFLRKSF